MSIRDTLRLADPVQHLPSIAIDDRDEQLLQSILATPGAAADPRSPSTTAQTRRPRPARDWRPILATAVVAVVVAIGAFVAIRATPTTSSDPATRATYSSRHALEDAVFAKLDEVATGDIPVRQKSALTYTDDAPVDGSEIDLSGKDLFIAAACDGGGSIAIRETGRPDTALDCDTRAAIGPIDLSAALPENHQSAGLDVVVTAGNPRYVATAMAFAPTTSSTNDTAPRPTTSTTHIAAASCTPSDFTITAHLPGTVMNYTQSPVTLVQRASRPCALTSAFELDTTRDGDRVTAARLPIKSVADRGYPLTPSTKDRYEVAPGTRLSLRIIGTPANDQAGVGTYDRPAWLRINGMSVRLPGGELPANVVDHGVTLAADPR